MCKDRDMNVFMTPELIIAAAEVGRSLARLGEAIVAAVEKQATSVGGESGERVVTVQGSGVESLGTSQPGRRRAVLRRPLCQAGQAGEGE
jgi:hypothetical protein